MEKKIEQYLPLYLGQKVQFTDYECAPVICKLVGVCTQRTDHEEGCRIQLFEEDGEDGYEGRGIIWADEDTIELVLRPLSSMTEEEKEEMKTLYPHPRETGSRTLPAFEVSKQWAALQTQYLLSKGFDIFNLESSGLAIYEMNDKPETV